MKLNILFSFLVFTLYSFGSFAGVNATAMKGKIYKFAVSTSEFCTSPVTVYSNDNATYGDAFSQAALFQQHLDDGTYKCLMIEMSDNIKITPAANDGTGCVAGTESTHDFCRSSTQSYQLIDGTKGTCANGVKDERVAIYFSTISTTTDPDNQANPSVAFNPPASASDAGSKGLKLGSALVVSSTTTSTFVMDTTGRLASATDPVIGNYCRAIPLMSFK